ncbi:MAG: TetR family transcriptional regulator [Actinomycetes bacterium]
MAQRTPTRDLLLDAAADAVVAGEWARTRMADVARAAGLSRQTLYYEFGSKDGLAQALALREAERYVDGADAARAGHDASPAEALRARVEYTLRAAADNPLLKAVLTDSSVDGGGGLLPYITSRAEQLHEVAARRTTAQLLAQWPQLPADDVRLAADVVTRLTLSHLVLPGGRPEQVADDVARLVARLLPLPAENEEHE